MSDIFISYTSEDRDEAEKLALALESCGWSVWWDRIIPAGRDYDEIIEEALDEAQCVVVLWSNSSISSRWVKTEAEEGADRRILVPALLEDVRIPLSFRRIQAADLIDWNGSPDDSKFKKLKADVESIIKPSIQIEPAGIENQNNFDSEKKAIKRDAKEPDKDINPKTSDEKKVDSSINTTISRDIRSKEIYSNDSVNEKQINTNLKNKYKQVYLLIFIIALLVPLFFIKSYNKENTFTGENSEKKIPDKLNIKIINPKLSFDQLMEMGSKVYLKQCVACHQPNGQGMGMFPALRGNKIVKGELNQLFDVIVNGKPAAAMPAYGETLNLESLVAVITYIRNSWGNNMGEINFQKK